MVRASQVVDNDGQKLTKKLLANSSTNFYLDQ